MELFTSKYYGAIINVYKQADSCFVVIIIQRKYYLDNHILIMAGRKTYR